MSARRAGPTARPASSPISAATRRRPPSPPAPLRAESRSAVAGGGEWASDGRTRLAALARPRARRGRAAGDRFHTMIDLWLRTGTAGIILVPFVLLYSVAAGIVWLTHLSPARPFFASCVGIGAPFFGSVALL